MKEGREEGRTGLQLSESVLTASFFTSLAQIEKGR